MRFLVGWVLAMLVTALTFSIAGADDLPVPGEVRLFWRMEAFGAPPGTPRDYLPESEIGEIVPMAGGGVLVSVYLHWGRNLYLNQTLRLVRLASDGTELWRVDQPICVDEMWSCGNWDLSDTRIVPMEDDGFGALLGSTKLFRYDSGGMLVDSQLPSPCRWQSYDRLLEHDGSLFLAGDCERWNENTSGGAIVRWEPGCSKCWRVRLPLHADGRSQYGYGLDLDILSDGNLLWTIEGMPPMNLDPHARWQVRVTPSGQIVPPGPLETSLQSDRGEWQLFASALLPDGRLIRLLHHPIAYHDSRVQLEFWDGTGSWRINWRVLDFGRDTGTGYSRGSYFPEVADINVKGRSAFYLRSYNDKDLQIAGFDSLGDVEWHATLPINSAYAVGDGATSRVYIAGQVETGPGRRPTPAIYVTSVE